MAEPASTPPSAGPDWPSLVAGRIESVVGTLRQKTTLPAAKASRVLVYGLVAAAMAVIALLLLLIALIRLHVYLPFQPDGRKLWITYAVLGAISVAVGAFLWRKRRPQHER